MNPQTESPAPPPVEIAIEPSFVFYDPGAHGWLIVVLLTLILGGLAAWATGRAVALDWRPLSHALLAMLPLAAAVRFLHYALNAAPLLSWSAYLVDLAYLAIFTALAWRSNRAAQMVRQYPFAFERTGPLSWSARSAKPQTSQ